MKRQTSLEAYNKIKENGLLSKLKWKVYEQIFEHGPSTIAEVCETFGLDQIRSISPRFSELERMGVIDAVGKKTCSVTGNTALIWSVTGRVPRVLTKKEKLIQEIKRTEDKLTRLKKQLKQYEANQMNLFSRGKHHCQRIEQTRN